MTSKQIKEIFEKLPTKRKQVLLKLLAGDSRRKIALEVCDGSEDAVQQHLRQLYSNFRILGSSERKQAALITLIAKSIPELIQEPNSYKFETQKEPDHDLVINNYLLSNIQQNCIYQKILLVDDIPENCYLFRGILEEEGYFVHEAHSGAAALDYIKKSLPDLVITDIDMPGVNGFEIVKEVRCNQKLSYIPILMVTAKDYFSSAKAFDLNVDGFLRKPIEFDSFLAQVRSILRYKQLLNEYNQLVDTRQDFIQRLHHDIRTQVVAKDRMLKLIQKGVFGDIRPDLNEAIAVMYKSNKNQLEMIDKLRDKYLYEAGAKRLNLSLSNLVDLIQKVLKELSSQICEKGLELVFEESQQQSPKMVMGDSIEICRVINSLIDNAIKFTDSGKITIRLSSTTLPTEVNSVEQNEFWVIEVEDTGSGMTSEQQHRLFEFTVYQRDHIGLSLYLCRRIVEAHNGRIGVKSELGYGSSFIVCLPVSK